MIDFCIDLLYIKLCSKQIKFLDKTVIKLSIKKFDVNNNI